MIITDAHIHMYPSFNLDNLVEAAFRNLAQVASACGAGGPGVLFLADTARTDYFTRLHEEAADPRPHGDSQWRLFPTGETTSVGLEHRLYPGMRLYGIAGYQVVSREKLEVLGVGIEQRPADSASLDVTVSTILDNGGIAILPWGVGKWLGSRSRVLKAYISNCETAGLFVGDNGNRPALWPAPEILKHASPSPLRILSGSDPLPLSAEEERVGSFGSIIHAELDESNPAESIKNSLAAVKTRITPFGSLQSPFNFIKQQISLRLR